MGSFNKNVKMKKLFLSIVLFSSEYIVNGQIRLPDQILQRRVNASGVFRATATEFPLVPKPTGRVITLLRSRSTAAACPPLVGTASPSGCNKRIWMETFHVKMIRTVLRVKNGGLMFLMNNVQKEKVLQ